VCRHMHKLMAKLRLLTHAEPASRRWRALRAELNSARCQANDPRLKYQLTRHTPRAAQRCCCFVTCVCVRLTYCAQKRMMTQSADSISPRDQKDCGKIECWIDRPAREKHIIPRIESPRKINSFPIFLNDYQQSQY
jgi:hypothetical protein